MERNMKAKFIVVDGKTYNSVNDMPSDVRQKYEQAIGSLADTNSNQIPDVFENTNLLIDKEGNGVSNAFKNIVTTHTTVNSRIKIVIDGKEYNKVEDLPPEVRAKYEAAIARLDANHDGIPDFVEGMFKPIDQDTSRNASSAIESIPYSPPLPLSPTVTQTPDTTNGWRLMLTILLLFLLCAGAAGAWYFSLR
jgi:hypothetical protein